MQRIINYFVTEFGSKAKAYEVNIVGAGEPLLNFELVKKLRTYCLEVQERIGKPIVYWVFTNGTVFNEEIVNYFLAEKQGLTISLDGPPEIHDELRPFPNGEGSYKVISKWIQYIMEMSKGKGGLERDFWVSTVVTAKHFSIKDIVIHFRTLGIRNAQIRPIKTINPGLSLTQEALESLKNQYGELNDYLIDQAIKGNLDDLKVILNERDFWGRLYTCAERTKHRFPLRCSKK